MRLILPVFFVLFISAFAAAQTTKPAMPGTALELRATEAFNGGKYSEALPMLQQLAADLKSDASQADRVAMIQEQIRVCQKNTVKADPTQTARPAAAKLAYTDRTAHPAPKDGEVLELSIKVLGNFDYDAQTGSAIPDDVKALSGTTVRLTGFMIPMGGDEHITKFALVPSLFNCCTLGGPPQIQHTVIINCPKGKTVAYYQEELTVEGKLTVAEVKDDGYIVSIFAVEPTSVKPTAR